MVAVLGENGSGKSTLLRILAGAMSPDAGSVRLSGRIGFCPQECVLYPYLTAMEHFRLFGAAAGVADVEGRARALLERFRFDGDVLAVQASGGTRQKLNLALSLLADPPVLLLDEPYNGFDVETYRCFLDWTHEARAAGKCIVVVTHIAFDRERFDRILTLRDGVLGV